ncbi:MAG: sulfatase-like hydrolase/transferase [Promethearchaeota archaeon]
MSHPNIIVIVLDTLRGDRVISNKGSKILTPNIKKILKNSIFFENCIANSPWTLPSHFNIFTGLYNAQLKLFNNKIDRISTKVPIITEIFKNIGYFTACYSENPWINNVTGLSRGFNVHTKKNWKIHPKKIINEDKRVSFLLKIIYVIDKFSQRVIKINQILKKWKIILRLSKHYIRSIANLLLWKKTIFKIKINTKKEINKFFKKIKNKLNRNPAFLFFNLMITHDPFIPTKKLLKKFGITLKEIKLVETFLKYPNPSTIRVNLCSERLNSKQIKVIEKLYNSCVYYADQIIQEIFSLLIKYNKLEDSYVIITSDHGEHLCGKLDHYLRGHHTFFSVYESLLKVPLIIFNNNLLNTRIKVQVQLKDLFHTLLNLVENEDFIKNYFELKKSLFYQIENESFPEYIFGEYLITEKKVSKYIERFKEDIKKKEILQKLYSNTFFLRSNNYKYITYDDQIEEFYNLNEDKNEQMNIINISSEKLQYFKKLMTNYQEDASDEKLINHFIDKKEKSLIKNSIDRINLKRI